MEIVECWSIEVWDGGSMHNHKFYVATQAEAEKYMLNNKFDMITKKQFIIFDTLEEALDNDLATVRKRVIEKLTPLERRAMGVS
jgi:hypothetical protein